LFFFTRPASWPVRRVPTPAANKVSVTVGPVETGDDGATTAQNKNGKHHTYRNGKRKQTIHS
jgi:hypothetical protein